MVVVLLRFTWQNNAKIVSVAKSSTIRYQAGKLYWHCGQTPRNRTENYAGHRSPYFPRAQCAGPGEGNRAWDLTPKSSMTNGRRGPKVQIRL